MRLVVPKLIGGGGEVQEHREVLRHTSVEKCIMVDLDGTRKWCRTNTIGLIENSDIIRFLFQLLFYLTHSLLPCHTTQQHKHIEKVVDVSVKYLPEWGGQTVMKDPRFELIIGDAYEYLLNSNDMYDVVIMDISDPIEAGPGIMLYTKELYEHVATTKLTPNGVFVTQAGMADGVPPPFANVEDEKDTVCFGPINNTLQEVFQCVIPYTLGVPSFGADWGFVMGFNPSSSSDETEIPKY